LVSDALITKAYEASIEAFRGRFKWIAISAYKPGDEPLEDFPLFSTTIEADEVEEGQPPSQYWSLEGCDPSLC
jgi:hypothetical protein